MTKADATQALLVGTLAPGLNAPTWTAWKAVMLGLAVSLGALLWVALGSADLAIIAHVVLLIFLAGTLFALLSWFVAETGFVSVDQQMIDLNMEESEGKKEKTG